MIIRTFQECLKIANELKNSKGNFKPKHLILGNGFSIDLFPDIFNYKAISEKIKIEKIEYLFKNVGTNDFEYVLHKLNEAYKIVNVYSKELDTIAIEGAIGRDIEILKATLISIIATSHPKNPQTIDEEQYQACWQFLSLFEKYYSFNYDLILYWVFMHFMDSGKSLKCNDGFNYDSEIDNIVTYNIEGSNDQNIYYLHGALHIFDNGEKIEKFTCNN